MEPILAAVVPVALLTLVGYVLARLGRPVEGATLRLLVIQLGSPALVFTALQKTSLSGALLFDYAAASAAAIACFGVIGWCVLRVAGLSIRAFLPAMMFTNTGNLGLPLALYACGPVGLGFAAIFHSINGIGNFTVGQGIALGSRSWGALVVNPTLLATIAGLAAVVTHLVLPVWLNNSLELASGLTIPLMLLMLGTSLATIRVTSWARAVGLSVLRIGMGVAIGFALARLFALVGVPRAVFVLQCAMPVAVFNYLFALAAKTDPEGVASVVVVSTALSLLTIPALLAVLVAN
jgi:malate permease and related proteins